VKRQLTVDDVEAAVLGGAILGGGGGGLIEEGLRVARLALAAGVPELWSVDEFDPQAITTTVAIVGPTGAGKTTLVNLLMRFYEPDSGRILLGGRDIATMSRAELRSRIGMVLQDTWLIAGTIYDNIAYGRPDATEAEVIEAARTARVDHFVHTLPNGYQTRLNENGVNISAGEKQLITIARALVRQPQLLILDEATSSVDSRTELLIAQATAELRRNRTSFNIAHRLSTIRDADLILVVQAGRIVERGSHDELLQRRGAYWKMTQA